MPDVRQRLRESLKAALKSRDEIASAALRSALSAIANGEAVDPAPNRVRLGVGAADVPRRELSDAEVTAIIQAEIDERLHAAAEYERLGQDGQARRLRSEGDVLRALLT
jgi:uncharacterized protein YqeY